MTSNWMSGKYTISSYNHKKARVLNVNYHDDDTVNFIMKNNISLKIICIEVV